MKPAQLKMVATVVAGVMIAGWAMYQFRDVGIVAQARSGYSS